MTRAGEPVPLSVALEQLGHRNLRSARGAIAAATEPRAVRDSSDLRTAVLAAVELNRHKLADNRSRKRWCSPAWHFARALRDRPELLELEATQAAAAIGGILAGQFGGDGWQALGGVDSEGETVEPQTAFLAAWNRVEVAPLRAAIRAADASPVVTPGVPTDGGFRQLRRFASALAHLAAQSPEREIWISCRGFGDAFGVSRQTVSNWITVLLGAGQLHKIRDAEVRKLAAQYQWRGPIPASPAD